MFSLILLSIVGLAYTAPAEYQPNGTVNVYEDQQLPTVEPVLIYEATAGYSTKDNYEVKEQPIVAYETPKQQYESTLPPPVIEIVEELPANVHQKDVHEKQISILTGGKLLSEAITAKIVGPVVIFNSKVASAAAALPPLLAAKGAVIGSAIATPIEIGAVAGSSIVSGVTGKLVAVPIAVASGAAAKLVGAAEKGQQIWNFNKEHGVEVMKDGLIKIGHIILKPIAVVVGAQAALTGAGLGIAGSGIKGVGVGMEAVGGKMVLTGLAAKGLGHKLIKSQFLP